MPFDAHEALPVEAQLLLACACVELKPAGRTRIAASLERGYDAELLYKLAERHGLRPLLFRHLCNGGFGPLLRPLEARLWQYVEQLRRRNERLEVELLAVLASLAAAGIPAAAHKGPVLARLAFDDFALREYGDLDVLIPVAQVVRAREVLTGAGFHPEYPMTPATEQAFLESRSQYHLMLAHRESGLRVELHWKTDGEFALEDTSDPAWWRGAATVDIRGVPVRCLPREAMMLAHCLHGSKHHWSSLHWLVDVVELARRSPDLDWNRVLEWADQLQARRRLALGLRLGVDWLELALPVAIPEGDWAPLEHLASTIAHAWFADDPAPASPWQRLRTDSRLYDSASQRRQHFADTVLHPGLPEWSGSRLHRPLFFLFVPLRLGRLAWRQLKRLLVGQG